MDCTIQATLERIKARFLEETGSIPDLSSYRSVETSIEFRCPGCQQLTSRPWSSFNKPRPIRCLACANRAIGAAKTVQFRVLDQIRALCADYGVSFVEGSYQRNSQPFQFICRAGHLGSRKWMDVRQDHKRGTLRFHCALCWQTVRPRGEKHHWYKPERSDEERERDRNIATPGYFEWRTRVRARDRDTCRLTGKRGGDQAVHHLWNYADFPQLRLFVWNGVCLRQSLHDQFHQEYGKSRNTLEQLQRFAIEKGLLIPFLGEIEGVAFDIGSSDARLEVEKDVAAGRQGKTRVLLDKQDSSWKSVYESVLFTASAA